MHRILHHLHSKIIFSDMQNLQKVSVKVVLLNLQQKKGLQFKSNTRSIRIVKDK